MSKIHILEADEKKNYKVVIHVATPSGSNTAGKSWKSVALKTGLTGVSVLVVGSNPGEITQEEMDSITLGDVLEFIVTIPAESGGASTTSLNKLIDDIITEKLAELARRYKYYGYTQN